MPPLALPTRVGDAVSVLDALGIERAHYLGSSWGARLGFALGELAPERLLSLVLFGNQPYAWNLESPSAQAVGAAIAASRRAGMNGFVNTFETVLGYRFPEPQRTWTLPEERPCRAQGRLAIRPRPRGPFRGISPRWKTPCLICMAEADEMHDDAKRAAGEIAGARFVSLAGHSHISAFYEADDLLLPRVLEFLRSATPTR